MERVKTLLLLVGLTVYIGKGSGCQVEGVSNWWLDLSVVDTDRGVFFQGATTDISGIQSAEHSGDGLNSGPYFVASHDNSTFVLSLHDNFERYEEDETSQSMSISVTFSCSNGNTLSTVFIISVVDTNNNDPVYLAGDEITFTITPPLPPGYLVTGCAGGIDVRDIDLTTQRIEFEIEENDYFEIAYDAASSTEAKNFAAVLRTTTFIRSLQEPVSLRINATDVDQTGDPPRTTYATLRIEADGEFELPEEPIFSQVFYMATYSAEHAISLEQPVYLAQGYDNDVYLNMTGEYASNFQIVRQGSQVSIEVVTTLPADVITQSPLLLALTATREYTSGASATIVVQLPEALELEFEENHYEGTIVDDTLSLSQIVLTQGYDNGYEVTISSPYASFFEASQQNNIITLTKQPLDNSIIEENAFITLQLIATSNTSSATVVILLEIIKNDTVTPLFEERIYTGSYLADTGLDIGAITLNQGYDETVSFYMQGEYESYFTLSQNLNVLTLQLMSSLPQQLLEEEQQILLTIGASKPRTVGAHTAVSIALPLDTSSNSQASFASALYSGVVQTGEVSHEAITVSGYNGTEIQILGANADSFEATLEEGTVLVQASSSLLLPEDLTYVALELRAGNASTALILDIYDTEVPTIPTVMFSAASYEIRTDVSHTGLVGSVLATADNGETIAYRLQVDDAHLVERLAVSESGDLMLSSPANSGVYAFTVEAATVATQASASAPVQLIVDAITTCGDDQDLVVPPLIVLDRDEEEDFSDLILSNATGCRFQLTNRWPLNQDWLYVDERGLHARAIDRENPSIAFMALSQVQVELILECDNDNATTTRSKRSTDARLDPLGPYDYGSNKWLIADTILYNSRRSFVNVIVNDINDNFPIFEGKENEPIAVGYPIPELLDVVPPRALLELKATDADVGENAALLYWSSEPELAVSPSTGSVHVRDNQRQLEENRLLNVHATDRNGDGLTGDIQLVVRLLDVEHISVLTIRDAFLEEEQSILNNLTQAIGYELRALTSTVVSDEYENVPSGNRRQTVQARGASLRIYVYGLRNTVPVDVNELTSDINSNVIASVVIADTVSLQDYLESREIRVTVGRDLGLLAATIVLSVLLFILIVSFVLWFFLKWRKDRNYEEFTDQNSLASQKESVNVVNPKSDTLTKPRLNIDELKRSERRLQELLDTPVNDVVVEASSSKTGLPAPTILDLPLPDLNVPIVIQSIDKLKAADEDDEDEFGERKNNARRKSVVTFNENVEKIIHVEDRPDSDSDPEYEIEKL